jgi:argininosuccinate synthase
MGSHRHGREPRVGIKSREIYECPAALALLLAHRDLEDLTLERDVAHEKLRLEPRWAELVYDGLWFSPLKEALDAFFWSSQRHVTGVTGCRRTRGSRSGDQLPGAAS